MESLFRSVLVANRGECAVRIIGTLHGMGIEAIAVYSEADEGALHVKLADKAVCIGAPPAKESYLSIEKIINAAKINGAGAIHPGWGFLSEKAEFAQACLDAGISFIGPSPEAMNHIRGKPDMYELMKEFSPILPYAKADSSHIKRIKLSINREGITYPLLVKLSHGGGGMGIHIVEKESDLEKLIITAGKMGELAFAERSVFVQEYKPDFRHIEVQILADNYGNAVVLGFRDCSLQRNFQKVVEETAFVLDPDVRERMSRASISLVKRIGYSGAGTVEFLASGKEFYFLEMNKRLQVEHPVTEMTTYVYGKPLDLVEWQMRVADKERLFPSEEVMQKGHAIEARIYAEDPEKNFQASPGVIANKIPHGPYYRHPVRIDSGFGSGSVPPDYDMMLDKVIVYGSSRERAIARMDDVLRNFVRISGIKTNLGYLINIIETKDFFRGAYTISTLNQNHHELVLPVIPLDGHHQATPLNRDIYRGIILRMGALRSR